MSWSLVHTMCLYVCVSWGHLDVWGELASHKRSLTYRLSSQGWASRCPLLYLSGSWLGGLPFLCSYASVLFPCIYLYSMGVGYSLRSLHVCCLSYKWVGSACPSCHSPSPSSSPPPPSPPLLPLPSPSLSPLSLLSLLSHAGSNCGH